MAKNKQMWLFRRVSAYFLGFFIGILVAHMRGFNEFQPRERLLLNMAILVFIPFLYFFMVKLGYLSRILWQLRTQIFTLGLIFGLPIGIIVSTTWSLSLGKSLVTMFCSVFWFCLVASLWGVAFHLEEVLQQPH